MNDLLKISDDIGSHMLLPANFYFMKKVDIRYFGCHHDYYRKKYKCLFQSYKKHYKPLDIL
jgi:hypothetical protein